MGILEDFDAGGALVGFEDGGVAAEAGAEEPVVLEHGASVAPHIHADFAGPVLKGEFAQDGLMEFWDEGNQEKGQRRDCDKDFANRYRVSRIGY